MGREREEAIKTGENRRGQDLKPIGLAEKIEGGGLPF